MALVVDATNFIANSKALKEALKSANILKSLNISALIEGECGVGKLTLAKSILPNSLVISSSNINELDLIEPNSNIVVKHINKIGNIYKFEELIKKKQIRIVATSSEILRDEIADKLFGVRIFIPPLSLRSEDVKPLAKKFLDEAKIVFGDDVRGINLDNLDIDLSKNSYSLKRSVFLAFLFDTIKEVEIIKILEHYLENKIGSSDDYRKFLHLYEIPLIKTSLNKFKSQLKVSEKLGINRNTLRKKIITYKDYL